MTNKKIKLGVASEDEVFQEFIDVWHRAETEIITEPEEHLYFMDAATFFKVLSKGRIALLKALHSHESTSIRKLSQLLKRDYKNVHQDVQLLIKAGLITQDDEKRITVPWDTINTEITLAAA